MRKHRPMKTSTARLVKAERQARNWTQKFLSKKAGISEYTVCRIEQEVVKPDLQTIQKLADAFGVPFTNLIP